MATAIPTQGFQMSRLPEFARADPRDYEFDRKGLEDAISFVPRTLEGLEQISDRRFELGTRRATGDSRRTLAERTADAAVEDFEPTRENALAGLEADTAADRTRGFKSREELKNAEVNADIEAEIARESAMNRARKEWSAPEETRRARERQDRTDARADALADSLSESRRDKATTDAARVGVAASQAEVNKRYKDAVIADVEARARTRGGRVVDTQPVRFEDGTEAMVIYVQTIGEDGQPVLKSEFHELPKGGGFTRPQEGDARRALPPGMDLRKSPAGATTPAPAPAPTPAAPAAVTTPASPANRPTSLDLARIKQGQSIYQGGRPYKFLGGNPQDGNNYAPAD